MINTPAQARSWYAKKSYTSAEIESLAESLTYWKQLTSKATDENLIDNFTSKWIVFYFLLATAMQVREAAMGKRGTGISFSGTNIPSARSKLTIAITESKPVFSNRFLGFSLAIVGSASWLQSIVNKWIERAEASLQAAKGAYSRRQRGIKITLPKDYALFLKRAVTWEGISFDFHSTEMQSLLQRLKAKIDEISSFYSSSILPHNRGASDSVRPKVGRQGGRTLSTSVLRRTSSTAGSADIQPEEGDDVDIYQSDVPSGFFQSPYLWVGLGVGAALLVLLTRK